MRKIKATKQKKPVIILVHSLIEVMSCLFHNTVDGENSLNNSTLSKAVTKWYLVRFIRFVRLISIHLIHNLISMYIFRLRYPFLCPNTMCQSETSARNLRHNFLIKKLQYITYIYIYHISLWVLTFDSNMNCINKRLSVLLITIVIITNQLSSKRRPKQGQFGEIGDSQWS